MIVLAILFVADVFIFLVIMKILGCYIKEIEGEE